MYETLNPKPSTPTALQQVPLVQPPFAFKETSAGKEAFASILKLPSHSAQPQEPRLWALTHMLCTNDIPGFATGLAYAMPQSHGAAVCLKPCGGAQWLYAVLHLGFHPVGGLVQPPEVWAAVGPGRGLMPR